MVELVLKKLNKNPGDIAISRRAPNSDITWYTFVDIMIANSLESQYYIAEILNYKYAGLLSAIKKQIKPQLNNKPPSVSWGQYLLSLINKRMCSGCKEIKNLSKFSANPNAFLNKVSKCSICMKPIVNAKAAKRKAAKLQRTVGWADLSVIKEIYKNCPEGYHVDHIIPLQGKNVSGLHVENNLQYLTAFDNLSKGNKYE